jgi:death on curing protein
LLQSALSRPVNRWLYREEATDFFDLAAAYAFGLAKNHPFNDGNKRTAWHSCSLFLRANGVRLDIGEVEADVIIQMIRVATDELDEAGFAAWLRGLPRG